MRSDERLKKSYEKQKEMFDVARNKKLVNLRTRQQQIAKKIEDLQLQLQDVEAQIIKEEARTFQSFPCFREKALAQSEQKRTERIS